LKNKRKTQLKGVVLMENTLYPMGSNIVVYQEKEKIAETVSNIKGYFDLPLMKIDRDKVITFVLKHESFPDTIFEVNGYERLLYSCSGYDTIHREIINIEDTISLIVKKCTLFLIPDSNPNTEHE
jgi:hypothetical protein